MYRFVVCVSVVFSIRCVRCVMNCVILALHGYLHLPVVYWVLHHKQYINNRQNKRQSQQNNQNKKMKKAFQEQHSKSRWENPQKLIQLSPRSHPRHLVGKRTAQKDAIKDINSDSQVSSYFPYRWSPASLTFLTSIFTYFYIYI